MSRTQKPYSKPALLTAAILTAATLAAKESSALSPAAEYPLACAFLVEDSPYGTALKGVVTAHKDISGQFEMTFEKTGRNSAHVKQMGGFDLYAGETATLGQATLGRGDIEAKLTLVFDGMRIVCRTSDAIDI